MKDIVNWLRKVEHLAHEVYSQAAEFYKKDTSLKMTAPITIPMGIW